MGAFIRDLARLFPSRNLRVSGVNRLLTMEMRTQTITSVLFVTHNVREAACLGNRVILFSSHPGRIREEFKIDLERPRDINSIQLASYSMEIMRALKGYVTQEASE